MRKLVLLSGILVLSASSPALAEGISLGSNAGAAAGGSVSITGPATLDTGVNVDTGVRSDTSVSGNREMEENDADSRMEARQRLFLQGDVDATTNLGNGGVDSDAFTGAMIDSRATGRIDED